MTEQQKAFARVLDLIEDAGCLPHVILVGSWVEFVYREAGILKGFMPNIRTLDVDFLIRNLRQPNPAAQLASFARENGFFVESDVLNGTTKILDASSGLEVEFLIAKRGAGAEVALKTHIGVTAQTLRHMDIMSKDSIEVVCLGHLVRVPSPEAYVVHKMAINDQRGAKAEKDAQAVLGMWPYLDEESVHKVLDGLTKKERKRIESFAQKWGVDLDV